MQTKIENWIIKNGVALGYTLGFFLGLFGLYLLFSLCLWRFTHWPGLAKYLFVFISGFNVRGYFLGLKSYLR